MVWPITILLSFYLVRNQISAPFSQFFSKNTVSEISASATGVTAKFVNKQLSTESNALAENPLNLPQELSADSIKERHRLNQSEFSEKLYNAIQIHLSALNLPEKEQIDILMHEASLLQAAVHYFDLNKMIFRSQFDLLYKVFNSSGLHGEQQIIDHFELISSLNEHAYTNWTWVTYIEFLTHQNLLENNNHGYQLTVFGRSYVKFMINNPNYIDELLRI